MVRYRRKNMTGAKSPPHTSQSSSSSEPPSTTNTVVTGIRRRHRIAPSSSLSIAAAAAPSSPTLTNHSSEETSQELAEDFQVQVPTEVEPWGTSSAKDHLKSLLQDETSWVYTVWNKEGKHSQASRIEEIRIRSPLFQPYAKHLFYTNFRNLKDTIDIEKTAVAFDKWAFDEENKKWPINSTLANGKPRWQDSGAQKQLREDLKDPGKKNRKPRHLYFDEDRELYRAWSLEEFRNFLYEEKKWETQGVYSFF